MKRSKLTYVARVFFAVSVLCLTLVVIMSQSQTQAEGDPTLTPNFLAIIKKDFTPTPTPTSTPTPTATPVPTAIVTTSGDTSVLQGFANSNFSNDSFIYTGYHKSGCFDIQDSAKTNRGLLKFSIPNTPPGAIITEANLSVYLMAVCWLQDGSRNIEAYRITENWITSTVNWNNQPSRSNSSSGSTSIQINSNVLFDWYTLDITGLVQNWASGTVFNHGLMLRAPEDSDDDFAWIVFASQEFGGVTPHLTITYSNGTTAVISLDNTTPTVDLTPVVSCGATPEGMSFCSLDEVVPLTID